MLALQQEAAAVRIQAVFRGGRARDAAWDLYQAKLLQEDRVWAAKTIQSVYRGRTQPPGPTPLKAEDVRQV